MTEIQKSKQCLGLEGLVIEYWNLKFICNLVLGICDFRHKTPRQSQISLTWPRGPDFSGLNKI
jgi:hypothetical protein